MIACRRSPSMVQLPYHPSGLNFDYDTEVVRFDRDLKNGDFTDEDGNRSASSGHQRSRPGSRQRRSSESQAGRQPAAGLDLWLPEAIAQVPVHPVPTGSGRHRQSPDCRADRRTGPAQRYLRQQPEPWRADRKHRQRSVLRSQYPMVRQELSPDPRTAPVLPLCA